MGTEFPVLIGEDDAVSRALLSADLRKAGYVPEVFSDGLSLLERFGQRSAPRLALVDWMMPGMDGIEVCRKVRALPTDAPPYLIMLTARADTKSTVEGLDAGANDYVVKPYDREELRARVGVGRRVVELQEAVAGRVRELEEALAHIKTLQGIIPICMYCHKIRNDRQSWERVEHYIMEHPDAQFSHGVCPECMAKHHPDVR